MLANRSSSARCPSEGWRANGLAARRRRPCCHAGGVGPAAGVGCRPCLSIVLGSPECRRRRRSDRAYPQDGRLVRRGPGARAARPRLQRRRAARPAVRSPPHHGWDRARLRVRRAPGLRPIASLSGALLPARRHRARPCRSGQSHQGRRAAQRSRRDSGLPEWMGAGAVVVVDAGRQPRAHSRSAQAHLQHRRKSRVPDGHLRRRHRRVLHGVQGHDRVGELPSDDWQHDGARHAVRACRRRDVSGQRGQQAVLCRQHRARSALSGAHR